MLQSRRRGLAIAGLLAVTAAAGAAALALLRWEPQSQTISVAPTPTTVAEAAPPAAATTNPASASVPTTDPAPTVTFDPSLPMINVRFVFDGQVVVLEGLLTTNQHAVIVAMISSNYPFLPFEDRTVIDDTVQGSAVVVTDVMSVIAFRTNSATITADFRSVTVEAVGASETDAEAIHTTLIRLPHVESIVRAPSAEQVVGLLNLALDMAPIQFANNGARVTVLPSPALDAVAITMQENSSVMVEIHAYANGRGSSDSNHSVSIAKAQAVARVLVGAGIDSDRLVVVGRGSTPTGSLQPEVVFVATV